MEQGPEPDRLPQQEPEKPEKLDEKNGWFPRPPRITNAADFIVIVFACTVALILVALTFGVILAAFFGGDIKSYFAILTSIMTSIISALVGYLAGRSQGGPPPPPPPAL